MLGTLPETMTSLGAMEIIGAVQGGELTDAMIKAADVVVLWATPVCAGKYVILVAGELSEVDAAMDAARRLADHRHVADIVIPRATPSIMGALTAMPREGLRGAFGCLESMSAVLAIRAADAAVKAADVSLLDLRPGIGLGGKGYFAISGDIGAVETALQAAKEAHGDDDLLYGTTIVTDPHPTFKGSIGLLCTGCC